MHLATGQGKKKPSLLQPRRLTMDGITNKKETLKPVTIFVIITVFVIIIIIIKYSLFCIIIKQYLFMCLSVELFKLQSALIRSEEFNQII